MFNTGDLILDAVILSIVAQSPEGTYGYRITQEVRSKLDVPESTFYPLLKQMEIDGYLEVYHKDIGGRSRRFYKITDSGKERLAFCQQNWTNYLQNASALLMSAPVEEAAAPQKTPDTAPSQQESANEYSIAMDSVGQMEDSFEFSIGQDSSDASLTEEEGLFEFDNTMSIPDSPVISIEDAAAPADIAEVQPEEPVYDEASADEADFLAEMALGEAEEEIATEAEPAEEHVVSDKVSELEGLLSQLRSFESQMTAHSAYQEQKAQNTPAAPVEAAEIHSAPAAEAAPQTTSTYQKYAEVRNPDTDDTVNSLVDLLKNDEPAKKTGFFSRVVKSSNNAKDKVKNDNAENNTPVAAKTEEPVAAVKTEESVVEKESAAAVETPSPARYAEVRNPDTDDSVNSLVDLLKNDEPAKKARFFKPRAKKETVAAPVEKITADAVPQPVKAPEEPQQKKPETIQAHKIQYKEVRNPDTNDAVNSLVDLLKDDDTSAKPKLFRKASKPAAPVEKLSSIPTPVAEVKPAEKVKSEPVKAAAPEAPKRPAETVAKAPHIHEVKASNTGVAAEQSRPAAKPVTAKAPVEQKPVSLQRKPQPVAKAASNDDGSVDNLVELLRGNQGSQQKTSMFSKAKPYAVKKSPIPAVTRPSTENTEQETAQVIKPEMNTKSFEAKAASPNARPVETRATITKPLEAKAISTKPATAKPAEAKSVETKAVVTPKEDTKPASAEAPASEEIDINSFKYRLMQANLLPNQDK